MANERRKSSAVSVGNWMWSLVLAAIPVVNLVYFIITACATRKASKRAWAIANIIWIVLLVAIVVCAVTFFGDEILAGLLYLTTTPVTDLMG